MNSIKLQKYLADCGIASRRHAEAAIAEGQVTVNGQVAHVGQRVLPQDQVNFRGQEITHTAQEKPIPPRLLIYHKPLGQVCSQNDPEGRTTVFEALPPLEPGQRWIMVGRLDINTSGLLVFSNRGDWAHALMHPRFGHDRHYQVRVYGDVSENALKKLRQGVIIEGRQSRFKRITCLKPSPKDQESRNQWFQVVIQEGRHRIVRRLWESQNLQVNRLIRVQHGPLTLPSDLKIGQHHEVDPATIKRLSVTLSNALTDSSHAKKKYASD